MRYLTPSVRSLCIRAPHSRRPGEAKLIAKAGGAAKLRLQYRVTPGGEKLCPPVEVRPVAALRTAVRQYHQWQSLAVAVRRQREIGRNRQAVTSLVADGLNRAGLRAGERRGLKDRGSIKLTSMRSVSLSLHHSSRSFVIGSMPLASLILRVAMSKIATFV
jgi:hypothetical protein